MRSDNIILPSTVVTFIRDTIPELHGSSRQTNGTESSIFCSNKNLGCLACTVSIDSNQFLQVTVRTRAVMIIKEKGGSIILFLKLYPSSVGWKTVSNALTQRKESVEASIFFRVVSDVCFFSLIDMIGRMRMKHDSYPTTNGLATVVE